MLSELTATKFLLLILSNGEVICFHHFYLCVALDLHLTLFSGRGTLKMLLFNVSCIEQIFTYHLQLPAGLCFDFGINLELMS